MVMENTSWRVGSSADEDEETFKLVVKTKNIWKLFMDILLLFYWLINAELIFVWSANYQKNQPENGQFKSSPGSTQIAIPW